MAKITITIPNAKVDTIAADISPLFDREADEDSLVFIKRVVAAQLAIVRKIGKKRKAVEAAITDDVNSDIDIE